MYLESGQHLNKACLSRWCVDKEPEADDSSGRLFIFLFFLDFMSGKHDCKRTSDEFPFVLPAWVVMWRTSGKMQGENESGCFKPEWTRLFLQVSISDVPPLFYPLTSIHYFHFDSKQSSNFKSNTCFFWVSHLPLFLLVARFGSGPRFSDLRITSLLFADDVVPQAFGLQL